MVMVDNDNRSKGVRTLEQFWSKHSAKPGIDDDDVDDESFKY